MKEYFGRLGIEYREVPRRPFWRRALGAAGAFALGVGFWWFFFWAGTRLWR